MSSYNDILGYQGSIKVSILKNRKVVSEKTFKNKGRWPLFQHLVHCLAGNYVDAEGYRPLYIGIYSIPYTDGNIPEIKDDGEEISTYANNTNKKINSVISYMEKPTISVTKNKGIGSASITYRFIVPFTNLSLKADESWKKKGYLVSPLNLICLHGAFNTPAKSEGASNPCTYFFVADPKNTSKLGSLLPKEITGSLGEYSLDIKWTLTLSNIN